LSGGAIAQNTNKGRPLSRQTTETIARTEALARSLQSRARLTDDEITYLKQLYENKANAEKNQDSVNQKYKADLIEIENRVAQSELNYKADTQKIQNDISQAEARVSQEEAKISQFGLTLGGQYFQIFGTMLGIAVALGGVAVYVVQKSVAAIVLKQAEDFLQIKVKEAEVQITDRIGRESFVTIGETFAQLAYP
jgi:hypothetical protein